MSQTGRSVSVIPARFERATHSLEGCCSIQLSYGTLSFAEFRTKVVKKIEIPTPADELFHAGVRSAAPGGGRPAVCRPPRAVGRLRRGERKKPAGRLVFG